MMPPGTRCWQVRTADACHVGDAVVVFCETGVGVSPRCVQAYAVGGLGGSGDFASEAPCASCVGHYASGGASVGECGELLVAA